MSGNFLSCSKGVKDPLEVSEFSVITPYLPQQKWASSRLEGRTSWIFSVKGIFSEKTGKSYDAVLTMSDDGKKTLYALDFSKESR